MEIKPRSKGKITKCLAIRDMYKYYKDNCKPNELIESYKTFSRIIKACNLETRRLITEESETFKMPYREGLIKITKYERSYNQEKYKWALDFKKTKELGFNVYFDQPYIYKWEWIKKNAVVKNKSKYKFVPCRDAKRLVPMLLRTSKIDYYG